METRTLQADIEESHRRENGRSMFLEDIENENREVTQLNKRSRMEENRLAEMSGTGAIGTKELENLKARIRKQMEQVEIRKMQTKIRSYQMSLDEIGRTGVRSEYMGKIMIVLIEDDS